MLYGYSFLASQIGRTAFPPRRQAENSPRVKTRVESDGRILFPASAYPDSEDPLIHVLFALRHEGVNLQILSRVVPEFAESRVRAAVCAKPNSVPVRKLAFLWEFFTGRSIDGVQVSGRYVPLFDPDLYVTAPGSRNPKWRIEFNGLGSMAWCATVEKTEKIRKALSADILQAAAKALESVSGRTLDRALGWAFLNEAKGSFDLEREPVSGDKPKRFVHLLRHAHESRVLSEDYLCDLQHEIVANPFLHAFSYRTNQNWLGGGTGSAADVAYVPPPPECLDQLMQGWLQAANTLASGVHPVIAASVVSFGFVYLHPFMDGNGRLSRFLIHQQIQRSGGLASGRLLPVSIAMRRNEERYLAALSPFSAPARRAWEVVFTGGTPAFEFSFPAGADAMYRYWDATGQTEFLFDMFDEALNVDLKNEIRFIGRFDLLDRAVNEMFDLELGDRQTMVAAWLNAGSLSKNFRKKFRYRIPEQAMDWLEQNAAGILGEGGSPAD